MKNNLIFIKTH